MICKKFSKYKDDWFSYEGKIEKKVFPCEQNKNNDCKGFKDKNKKSDGGDK